MRAIDGEHICKIISYLKKMEYDERDEAYNSAIDDIIVEIQGTSTINIAPIRGSWVICGQGTFCPVCHKEALTDNFGNYVRTEFCPRCGADLRGNEVTIDEFINRDCSITLKDGRELTGKLTADSRYLNIVEKDSNMPYSFYGKDITHINGIPLVKESGG